MRRPAIQKDCLRSGMLEDMKEVSLITNCKLCIPVFYSAFFNVSQIEICSGFKDHFCDGGDGGMVMWDIISKRIAFCRQQGEQKYFKGMAEIRKDFTNFLPSVINEEREKRTLMVLYWNYHSNLTTISEEKLVYGAKDLLAWLGGALGIFVGYSFLDLVKHFIDIAFYFVYRVISKH